jgi:probable rRNA maturation factor
MSRTHALAVAVQNVSGEPSVPSAVRLRKWARKAFSARARGELTLRIVAAEESADLNSRYRGKQGPTNVLSFGAEPRPVRARTTELLPLGDLVICAPVVEREAREQGKALDAHWAHMVVHGALHLQGFDHETRKEATEMESRERALLADLGFPDPYSV